MNVGHLLYTYILKGIPHFTAVDCGTLINPAKGQVNHTAGTTFRQTVTYTCNTGYILVGESTHMCQATGEWSGIAPTCQRMFLLPFLALCAIGRMIWST